MKSLVIKRSIVVAGHKTSVSLEDAFWSGLKQLAQTSTSRCRKLSATSTSIAIRATFRRPSGFLCWIVSERQRLPGIMRVSV